MAETTEMHSVPVDGRHHDHRTVVRGPVSAWPRWTLVSCAHLLAAILLLCTAIAAAVGLGRDDWYVRERYVYGGLATGYSTSYYGLRKVVTCPFENSSPPSDYSNTQSTWATCTRAPYYGIRRGATGDARDAYRHLEAAGDVVIAMLSVALALSILGMLLNFFHSFHYSQEHWFANRPRHHRASRLLALLSFIFMLLAIIFWITIYPYKYIRDSENAGFTDYEHYYTIGTGLGIVIAGMILALIAFIITGRNPHNHDGHHKDAVTPGGVALPNNNADRHV